MSVIKSVKNRKVLPIFLVPFLGNTIGMMANSVLVLFALDVGSTLTQIGLMRSIGGAMGIALRIPFGILSDKYGRKSMIIMTQILMAVGDAIRCVATAPIHVILASTVGGIAGGGFFPILLSAIGDLTSIRERSDAISTLYFFSSMGMLAGPTLASILLLSLEIRTLFYIALVSRIVLIVFLFFTIKSGSRGEPRRLSLKGNVMEIVKQRNMIVSMVTSASFYFTNSAVQTYMPIFARQELSLSDALVASLSTFRSLMIMIVRFFMQSIISRISQKRLLIAMLITATVAGFAIPYVTGYYSLIPLAMTFGMCFGIISVNCALLVSSVTTPTNRGLANSIHSLTTSAGMFAPLTMTPIAEMWGVTSVFTTSAFLPLMAVPPIFFLLEPLINRVQNGEEKIKK
jgi:MFS family permease